jgi:hypothetical protein
MKKLFTLLALIVITTINAQAPQGFNYQATVRNASGALVVNQNVLFKFNIMQNSQTSLAVYSETHQAPTDDLGQVNLTIGTGTPTTGTFAGINWGSGSYFLGIELNTGTGYVAMGTTQLLSVPYALYANSAGSTTGNSGEFTHYIGELFGGGIVVSVWKTAGVEHGLIASMSDLSAGIVWSNVEAVEIGTTAQNPRNGQLNTIAIISQSGHTTSAAKLCDDYIYEGYSDWYLPSFWELNQCYNSASIVNEVIGDINGFTASNYSSSTELNDITSNLIYFNGLQPYSTSSNYKYTLSRVRAVRRF